MVSPNSETDLSKGLSDIKNQSRGLKTLIQGQLSLLSSKTLAILENIKTLQTIFPFS